jgi:hypothetical protein
MNRVVDATQSQGEADLLSQTHVAVFRAALAHPENGHLFSSRAQ